MISRDFLVESNWFLNKGDELSNPKTKELAKVININTYDRYNKSQATNLLNLSKKYGYSEAGRKNTGFSSYIPLNLPINDNEHRYAHAIEIEIIASDSGRKGKKFLYVYYDNNPTKTWSSYERIQGNNPTTELGRNRIRNQLSKNLLTVEPYNRDDLIKAFNDKNLRNRSLAAGNYWQKVDISTRKNRARDRLSPNQIGSLYNAENKWWNQHPEIIKLINYYRDKINQTNRKTEKAKLERELNKEIEKIKSIGPDINMIGSDENVPINVNNISDLITKTRARRSDSNYLRSSFPTRKKTYLTSLLQKFTENINSPQTLYPFTIIDDTRSNSIMTALNIGSHNSIVTNFMEVVHPIAISTGNYVGSARNYVLEHLGVKSYDELSKIAAISYGSNNTGALVDSFIYTKTDNEIKKLQISSKAGQGASASTKSLQVAYDEVMKNSVSAKLWAEVTALRNTNDDYRRAIALITSFTDSKTKSWQDAINAARTFNLITEKDQRLIMSLAPKNTDIDDEDEDEDEVQNSNRKEKIKISSEIFNQFSEDLKDSYINSSYTGQDQFTKLISGLWEDIIDLINSNNTFSNLVVWLFNHSATIQVNTITNINNNEHSLILKSIIGTWPTQLVDRAELTMGQTAGEILRFTLKVNGYDQELASIDTTTPLTSKYSNSTQDPYSMIQDPYSTAISSKERAKAHDDKVKYSSLLPYPERRKPKPDNKSKAPKKNKISGQESSKESSQTSPSTTYDVSTIQKNNLIVDKTNELNSNNNWLTFLSKIPDKDDKEDAISTADDYIENTPDISVEEIISNVKSDLGLNENRKNRSSILKTLLVYN
jgi:hypothetical protein